MSSIEQIRHSYAHLLAAVIEKMYPGAKNTIGPAVENGFYYDFEFPTGEDDKSAGPTNKDFLKIESNMRKLLPHWKGFEKIVVTADEARAKFNNNPYKLELIEEIVKKGEKITLYKSGEFIDLCRGGHSDIKDMKPDAFKIDRIAGAYWRGDEKNKMLTRIYGLAFSTKEELDAYLAQQEEMKKRDHRILGKDLQLFTFSPIVGSGLPIWLPKGATVRRILERFIVDTEIEWGYLHVNTPDIAKLDLYKKSGHYPYYKESMYAPIKIDEDEFMLRPMTCPHHFQIFSDSPKSYRDLPMRIAELAKLYRYEASGELSGLIRVRGFCLADAHIIAADESQAKSEVMKALDLIEYIAKIFGLAQGQDYRYRLSLGDRSNSVKYYKNDEAWSKGEAVLREVLQERKCSFFEVENEAAFYGPKIDIQMKDVRGKENTAFTVQYDFCMPDRFELEYTAQDGTKRRPIVIHRSSIGAIERVMAFLIEHYAGNFPLWLAPVQVKICPVRETNFDCAKEVGEILAKTGIRVDVDLSPAGFGKKIREANDMKIPYTIIIGDQDMKKGVVTLESRDKGKIGEMEVEKVSEILTKESESKK
ncbi:MAG: threonine--tRNA ligase [Candidatus Paceibacterota bacterium]